MTQKNSDHLILSARCGENLFCRLEPDGTLFIEGEGEAFYDAEVPWNNHRDAIRRVVVGPGCTGMDIQAFAFCPQLVSAELPGSMTHLSGELFRDCERLRTVSVPEGISEIYEFVFDGCAELTGITIPQSVRWIGTGAFWGCRKLNPLVVPDGVTRIDHNAFRDVTHVIYHGPAWSEDNWGAGKRN